MLISWCDLPLAFSVSSPASHSGVITKEQQFIVANEKKFYWFYHLFIIHFFLTCTHCPIQLTRKSLERAVRQNPRCEKSWRRLAECLIEEGRWKTAVRVTEFMAPPHQPEGLLLWTVAHAMADRKRSAYSAAASLVRNFPDKPQHWTLLRWTSLAIEKRNLPIPDHYEDVNQADWKEFAIKVRTLDDTLKSGG